MRSEVHTNYFIDTDYFIDNDNLGEKEEGEKKQIIEICRENIQGSESVLQEEGEEKSL